MHVKMKNGLPSNEAGVYSQVKDLNRRVGGFEFLTAEAGQVVDGDEFGLGNVEVVGEVAFGDN